MVLIGLVSIILGINFGPIVLVVVVLHARTGPRPVFKAKALFLSSIFWATFIIASRPKGSKHITSVLMSGASPLRKVFSKTFSDEWGKGKLGFRIAPCT